MANNTNSFPVLWLSLLISGLAVPLSPIATIAQVQDNSNPELALESSSVQGISSEQTQKAVEFEPSQLRGTITEIDSVADRTLAPTQTAETVTTIEPKIMGTIRELPPKELETTNFPQSQKFLKLAQLLILTARLTALMTSVYNKMPHKSHLFPNCLTCDQQTGLLAPYNPW
ncbi:MAG: hypothetical protein ACM65K_04350 [Microcoleus sp.]